MSTVKLPRPTTAASRDLWGSLGVKLIFLPITAVLALVALNSISVAFSDVGVGLYGLVVVIPLVIPFADLGLGGSVTEVVAARRLRQEHFVRQRIRNATAILVCIGLSVAVCAILVGSVQGWSIVIGIDGRDANIAFSLALALFGLCIPLALGYRILLGLQRNTTVVAIQSGAGALGYIWIIIAAKTGCPLWLSVVGPQLVALVSSATAFAIAIRVFSRVDEFGTGDGSDFSLFRMARSNLVVLMSIPIAYQGGRFLLAHSGRIEELAHYTAAFAFYAPVAALVASAGQSLWPRFSGIQSGSSAEFKDALRSAVLLFTSFGSVALLCLSLVAKPISQIVLDEIDVPWALFFWFGLLAFFVSVQYPFGMALMGPSGVRFQSVCFALMAASSIALSWLTIDDLGSVAAVIGPLMSLVLVVLVPAITRTMVLGRR